jgi:hypothetical protein
MDLSLLATLKEKLVQAGRFADVATYFMDHFGENPEFMALGERTRHELLEAVLGQIGQQLFGGEVTIRGLVLTRLADEQFIHGGALINGCLAMVIFFEDVEVGLATLAPPPPAETKFARFSTRQAPPSLRPSLN